MSRQKGQQLAPPTCCLLAHLVPAFSMYEVVVLFVHWISLPISVALTKQLWCWVTGLDRKGSIGSYLSSETYAGLVVVSLQVSGVIDLESSVPGWSKYMCPLCLALSAFCDLPFANFCEAVTLKIKWRCSGGHYASCWYLREILWSRVHH